jgi:glycosyltransferase involved in cell wall biosynthesis
MREPVRGISVFFPAFNDEKTIGTLVNRALSVLPTITNDYEVIVVNDGSSDATAEVIDEIACTSSHVRVVTHKQNQGYGSALRSGFQHATKDWVFYTDGDGQYDIQELVHLLPQMTQACDVVNGYKLARADSRRRIFAGALYNRAARLLFQLPVRDVDCDFRLIRRKALNEIDLVSSSGVICVEMIYKLTRAGCAFSESPVHHYPRPHGRSQFFTFGRVARTLFDFLSLWIKLVILRIETEAKA